MRGRLGGTKGQLIVREVSRTTYRNGDELQTDIGDGNVDGVQH